MQPQNQQLYLQFQSTISQLKQRKQTLENDMLTVQQQLDSMGKELENLDKSIILHQGGMSSIEVLTNSGIALVQYEGEAPLSLSHFPVTNQVAQAANAPQQQQVAAPPPPPPQQYAQQPTQGVQAPQPPITPQAQEAFTPPSYPSQADMQAAQAIQGPQIVQGPPPSTE